MKTCPVCEAAYPDQQALCTADGAVLLEMRELVPGQNIRGKYRIIRKLGQGGMGVVYLAEHLLLKGQAALKFLAPELSSEPRFLKRFRNEARASYMLQNPNIVQVTDLDQAEDGSLFIAMEYVAGPSLNTVLRQANGPLPVERALNIARGIASGLAAAHARGAVHRDIKPDNILLATSQDGSEVAKILDFGIAVISDAATNQSRTHGVMLTPQYAAPEQWRGLPAEELDGRTDLYALGGVLYQMLTGRTPFQAANIEGWMYEHLNGVPEPLDALRPDLARDFPTLGVITMRLLARDREQRFQSAAAFLEALDNRTPSPTTYVPAPSPHQHAATVVDLPASSRTAPVTPQPAPVATRKSRNVVLWAGVAVLLAAALGFWAMRQFATVPPRTGEPRTAAPAVTTPAKTDNANPAKSPSTGTADEHKLVDAKPHEEKTQPSSIPAASQHTSDKPADTAANQDQPADTATAPAPFEGTTWTDPTTGLTWTRMDNGTDVAWQDAVRFCGNLQFAGHTDWRLPTIDELQGIYQSRVSIPAQCCSGLKVNWHVKGNLRLSGWLWSSSKANTASSAWGFNFDGGSRFASPVSLTQDQRALCVRRTGN